VQLGVLLPQYERGADPERYHEFARTAERRGFGHLLAYDHVLGPNPDRPDWEGVYTYEMPMHEPLTLFGNLAAVTGDIRLVTGVLVLPQRQTALVAKQAAEVDVLSGGRLRLGVGVGWNEPEYVALGEEFSKRGKRVEEQLAVLRKLWTQELVEFEGEFHDLPDVGINPRPDQQPIPLWLGGRADPVLRRIARRGDGWLFPGDPLDELADRLEDLEGYLDDEGRSLDDLALVGRMDAVGDASGAVSSDDPGAWREQVRGWRDLGATHLAVGVEAGDEPPLERLERVADAVKDVDGIELDS